MKLARAVHLDTSDFQVFAAPAKTDEWCVAGGCVFADWRPADLTSKARQAFAHGWLGLESFGHATPVAVAPVEARRYAALAESLAAHFVAHYGAPDRRSALPAAEAELAFMAELCAGHADDTLLSVQRELTDAGVRERFRVIGG